MTSGELISLKRLAKGYANIDYLLSTERGTFLYRVCTQNPRERTAEEMCITALLRAEDFPTAHPIERCEDGYILTGAEWPVLICEYVKGHVPQLSQRTAREATRGRVRVS